MTRSWLYRIYDRQELVHSGSFEGPVELGRRRSAAEPLYSPTPSVDRRTGLTVFRVAIADHDEDRVSRRHARIDPADPGRVRVENLSDKVKIGLGEGSDLKPGEARELFLPVLLLFSRRSVRILEAPREGPHSGARLDANQREDVLGSSDVDVRITSPPVADLGFASEPGADVGEERSRDLASRPEFLTARGQVVSVVSVSVRGLPRILRDLGPERALPWVDDLWTTLASCVVQHRGNRIGSRDDAFLALWAAPEPDVSAGPNHADRAARAVLAMLETMSQVGPLPDAPIALSMGLDTGPASVGRMGTSFPGLRPGAVGDPVRTAEHARRAAGSFQVSCLVTRAARDRFAPDLAVRRVGPTRLEAAGPPIELFELAGPGREGWDALAAGYEASLAAFEAGEFRAAVRRLVALVSDFPDDGPALALLARASSCLIDPPERFDPTFRV
jgi:class 3 adenylate cyclase